MATEELPPLASEFKRVVVLGGGIAGALLAKSLQFRAEVFLIDPYVSLFLSPSSLSYNI